MIEENKEILVPEFNASCAPLVHRCYQLLWDAYNYVQGTSYSWGPPNWEDLTELQQRSCQRGIESVINNWFVSPADQHDIWSDYMINQGWKYGDEKDDELKVHPCLVSFDSLSVKDQLKDVYFIKACHLVEKLVTNPDVNQEKK